MGFSRKALVAGAAPLAPASCGLSERSGRRRDTGPFDDNHHAPSAHRIFIWYRGWSAARVIDRAMDARARHTRDFGAGAANTPERLLGAAGAPLVRPDRSRHVVRRHYGNALVNHHCDRDWRP